MGIAESDSTRGRVLQVAYGCNPSSSMEARLGWWRAIASSQEFDTWVICAEENRPDIERYHRQHGEIPGLTLCYLASTEAEKRLYRTPGMFYAAYHRWHKRVLQLATRLHEEVSFDLAHQIGFCGYREPGYTWKLDIPFVWGPIGGTQNLPWRYLSILDPRGAIFEVLRTAGNHCHLRFRSRVRQAANKAVKIFAANSTAQSDFASVHHVQSELQLETGIDHLPDVTRSKRNPDAPLRILWAGRFRSWKALPLLLRSLAGLDQEIDYQVRIIGHEVHETAHRRLATQLGLDPHIEWLGWPDYQDTFVHYDWADVYAFTSLRDTSGTGLLEALAHGCPIVGMDHQGAGDIMTGECALSIPISSPRQTIQDFRAAFVELANNVDKLDNLSKGARQRAKDYLWSDLGAKMLRVYRSILDDTDPSDFADANSDREVDRPNRGPSEFSYT